MWKIALGFVVFAALAVFMLSKGGDIDISGEKHGADTAAEPSAMAASASVPSASVPAAPAKP